MSCQIRRLLLVLVLIIALNAAVLQTNVATKSKLNYFATPFTNLANLRNAELVKHNELRQRHGSPALILDDALNTAAQAYAEQLLASGDF